MTHYETLSIPHTATAREIKLAYHKLALAVHPDRNSELDAAERFREIAVAYEVLGNEDRRRMYDAITWRLSRQQEQRQQYQQRRESAAEQSAADAAWDAGDRFVNPDGFF